MDITQNPIIARMAGSLRGFLTGANNPTRNEDVQQGIAPPPVQPVPPPAQLQPGNTVGDPRLVTPTNPAGIRFADGGNYRRGSLDGGSVVGKGNGVSDSVPARYSDGEYVLPADTAAHIGHENLDALRDATHVPAAHQKSLRGAIGMADGGRRKLFSDGTDGPGGLMPYAPNVIGGQQANPAMAMDLDPVVDEIRAVNLGQPTSPGFTPYQRGRMPAMADPAVMAQQTSPISDAVQGLRGVFSDGTNGPASALRGAYPDTQAVLRGSGEDAASAFRAGNYGQAAGAVLRGTAALPVALAADTFGPAMDAYKGAESKVLASAPAGLRKVLGHETAPAQSPAPANALGTAGVPPVLPGNDGKDPSVVTAPRANDITRVGNSYSGQNISGTPTINGKAPGGGFMSMPGDAPSATTANQDEYARQVASAQATNAGGLAVAGAQQAQLDSERARQRAETQASSIHGPTLRSGRNALKALDARAMNDDRNASTLAGQQAQADASLRGHQVDSASRVQAALLANRGAGQAANATAAAKLAEENDKRQSAAKFVADAKGDLTQAAKNARAAGRNDIAKEYEESAKGTTELGSKATEAGTKALTTSLEALARKPDGTVDEGGVAKHRATLDRFIAARADAALKAGDTKGAAAIREAGASGLGVDRVQQIIKQQENLDASVKDSAWYNPFSSKGVHSDDPDAGQIVGRKNNLFQDEYVMRGGGTRPVNDVDMQGGLRSYRYDAIKNKDLKKVN